MAKKPLPSPEVLRQLLRYEPDTGKLSWLPRVAEVFPNIRSSRIWNTRFAGQEAFTSSDLRGYRVGAIFGHLMRAHRVIWALHSGRWPEHDVDHINGVRTDNRWENLRPATRSQNLCNRAGSSNSVSGLKGVSRYRNGPLWRARIFHNGKEVSLGVFPSAEEAHAAYCKAGQRLHGEFFNPGS